MIRKYVDNNKIYSVDMIFAYINVHKPKSEKIQVISLIDNLKQKLLINKKKHYSIYDVLANKNKHSKEMEKINNSKLKHPIIVYNNIIIDGIHRLAKAHLINKTTIKAYNIDNDLMKKFEISKNEKIYKLIELFNNRFKK